VLELWGEVDSPIEPIRRWQVISTAMGHTTKGLLI